MGSVYWITGLSGAGKTTIAQELHKLLKTQGEKVVFLDGDILREVFGRSNAYTRDERQDLALQYARLCKMLSTQDLNVICATISMFKECHQWNRDNIVNYREIYLRVPLDILKKRDSKQIYSRNAQGTLNQVMGVDIQYDEPEQPDLIIENDGSENPSIIARKIYEHFK
ncbi:MAG: adenylyl-sulfate kinase [Candidatus Omnitrophica bacterium]|nr:adenylyl-sulfate kinase [Candidatus Omnitrophota bacterium]